MGICINPTAQQDIVSAFLSWLHPCSCLQGGYGQVSNDTYDQTDKNLDLKYSVPELLNDIEAPSQEMRVVALKKIYELTRKRKHLRVPIVCTTEWNIVDLLTKCLLNHSPCASGHDTMKNNARRIACLTLNNLSIPYENKAVMMFGPGSTNLIENLVQIIRSRLPETYLACICLTNLSFLDDAIEPILNYSSSATAVHSNSQGAYQLPEEEFEVTTQTRVNKLRSKSRTTVDMFFSPQHSTSINKPSPTTSYIHSRSPSLIDSHSLLRTLESMMQVYKPFLMSEVVSLERESIRWAMGLLRNLSRRDTHCATIAKTNIPCLITYIICASPHPVAHWTENSLEDMSLLVLSRLARNDAAKDLLNSCDTVKVMYQIVGEGGIHATRADSIILLLTDR